MKVDTGPAGIYQIVTISNIPVAFTREIFALELPATTGQYAGEIRG